MSECSQIYCESTLLVGTNFLWFRENLFVYRLMNLLIGNTILQMYWKCPFHWEPNVLVDQIHENHKIDIQQRIILLQ